MIDLVGKRKNFSHFLTSVGQVIRYGYPARKLTVIGITGTDGKTTTSHLIYEILKKEGLPVALISTVGAFVGNEVIDTGYHVTTPDATVLQPLLKQFVKRGVKYLVLEATSHGLDQHRVLGCNFWAGVITNVTHEHLDYHKNFDKYLKAKSKLFRKVKVAVLNKDDSYFAYFKKVVPKRSKLTTYSLKRDATYKAYKISLSGRGMKFFIEEKGKSHFVLTRLIGDYNVSNILAAIAVARQLKISWETVLSSLETFKGVKGRMEPIDEGQAFSVIVDFAHTPNALKNLLRTVRKINKRGKIIVVFGCAGERDVAKRPMMGKISTSLADISIFTAEDPRHENVNDIIDQIAIGVEERKGKFYREPDRRKAIELAITKLAQKGDVVLVCGKGHEKSLAFGDKEIPWSDQEEGRRALLKLKRQRI